jgi:hypothetical protein
MALPHSGGARRRPAVRSYVLPTKYLQQRAGKMNMSALCVCVCQCVCVFVYVCMYIRLCVCVAKTMNVHSMALCAAARAMWPRAFSMC